MDSIRNTVSYCCVSKGGRILYTYNSGDHEVDNLAALCLEMTPPYHRWYFQTSKQTTFGFLIDDAHVYFAIVNQSLGNSRFLKFLHKLKDDFRILSKKGSTKMVSSLNALCLQEQLLPVVTPSPNNSANGHVEGTKAPLLGKPSKQDKKKMKEHVIGVRDIEMEEHRRSSDRGVATDSRALDSNNSNQGSSSTSPLRTRVKPSSQAIQKKWCRQVRIILAIDAVICIILVVIWLIICRGTKCIH